MQDDRQVTLGPGDFALFDPTRPYAIAFQGAGTFEHVIYQVPRAGLDARRLARNTTAVAVRAASTAGRLVSGYLQALAQPTRPGNDPPGQAFIDAGLDLAASALRAAADPAGQLDLRRRPLTEELKRYALAHLGDPALSPEAAARASYISVRQLHRLFAHDGTSFGTWVREQRWRRCRDDLASQQLSGSAIAEIAIRWGFRSPRISPAPSTHATASPRPNSAAPPATSAAGRHNRLRGLIGAARLGTVAATRAGVLGNQTANITVRVR